MNRYWRANNNTEEFVGCESAFLTGDVETLAEYYCIGTASASASTNTSISNASGWWEADDQCVTGSAGPLCAVCSTDFVKIGEECTSCPGGANYLAPAVSLLTQCCLLFLISLVLIYKTKEHKKTNKDTNPNEDVHPVQTEVKILVGWLQILSVITKTFDSVSWPSGFTSASQSTSVVNLDMSQLLSSAGACTLSIPFMGKFAISTSSPVGFLLSIKLAECVAICLSRKRQLPTHTKGDEQAAAAAKAKEQLQAQKSSANKTILLILLLLYPSIANQAFLMFRCRSVEGLMNDDGSSEKMILDKDYSIECFVDTHAKYLFVAFAAIIIYAMGVPITLFYMLWNNRKHLHEHMSEEKYQHHLEVRSRLGQFFLQCKWVLTTL